MRNFIKKHPSLTQGLTIFAIVIAIFTGAVLAATGSRNTVISMTGSNQATETTWTGTTTIDNVNEGKESQYRVYEDPISGYSIDCSETEPCLITRNADNNYTATITNTASFKVITYNKNGGTGTDIPDQRIDSSGNLATNNFTKADSSTSWTVNFDANTGSSTGAPSDKLTATKTVSYTANGWNSNSEGTGTNYTNGSSITPAANMTLYAKYNETMSGGSITLPTPTKSNTTSTISVTFNAGEHGTSTGATGNMINTTAPITWTSTGWWTETTDGTKVGNAGAEYAPTQNGVTLHAQWTSATGTYSAITLPTPVGETGYVLDGWYNGQTKVGDPGDSYSPTSALTLTAKWTAASYTYNIVYETQSGLSLGTDTVTHNYGETYTITPREFANYTTPGNQSVTWDSTTPKTITFKYVPVSYTITYDLNGQNPAPVHVNPKTSYTVEDAQFTIVNPTRTGYFFKGWTGSNGQTPETTVTVDPQTTQGNLSYTANWLKNNQVTIKSEVSGNMASRVKYFHYTIELANSDYTYASKTVNYTMNADASVHQLTFNAMGAATIDLQAGDSITLLDILEGTTVTIKQDGYMNDGYETNHLNVSETLGASDYTVTFTNENAVAVPTGIRSNTTFPLILLVIVAGIFAANRLFIRRGN